MAKRAMQAAVSSEWVHSFERAGLGKAPFRCVGYRVSKFQASPEAPVKPGSSCDYCGQSIMHVFEIVAADGQSFHVGRDCVERTGDTQLIESSRREYWAQERALRNAHFDAEAAARGKVRAAEMAETAARNANELAMVIEGAAVVESSQNSSEWDRNVAVTVYRELTTGERNGVTDREWRVLSLGYLAAILPASRRVGSDGDRLKKVRARYEGGPVVGVESPFGPSVLAKFRVIDGPMAGAVLVWKTQRPHATPGDIVEMAATVKGHGAYQGVEQTFVTRCKVTTVERSTLPDERE